MRALSEKKSVSTSGDSQKAEGHHRPPSFRLRREEGVGGWRAAGTLRPSVVAFPDPREELVGREREGPHEVDLVDEHHEPAPEFLQAFLQSPEELPHRPGVDLLVPQIEEPVLDAELLAHHQQHRGVPLLGIEVGAEALKIEQDRAHACLFEPFAGADHQRGLALLARIKDIGELAAEEGLVEVLVGLAHDIAGRPLRQGALRDEKPLSTRHCRPLSITSKSGYSRSIFELAPEVGPQDVRRCDRHRVVLVWIAASEGAAV